MTSLGPDFDVAQLFAEARALGAELYQQASRMSPEAVDSVAAVLFALESKPEGRLPKEVANEYARQMMADSAQRHRQGRGRHVRQKPGPPDQPIRIPT